MVKAKTASPDEYEKETNRLHIDGTINVLNTCKTSGIKRLIYFSSVAAMGYKKGMNIYDESFSPNPVDVYGKAKLAAERILSESIKKNELDITITRPVGIFGERGLGPLKKIIFFVEKGIIPILGSGNNLQSISYIGNIVDEAVFLANRTDIIGNTYILSDDMAYSVNTLVDAVAACLGKRPLKIHIPLWITKLSKNESIIAVSTERIFDASRIFKELGFKKRYDLVTGISRTVKWYKERCLLGA